MMLKKASIWLAVLGTLAVPMSSICAEKAPAGTPGCRVNVCHAQEAPSDCCEIGVSEAPVIPDAVKVSQRSVDPPPLAAVSVERLTAIARGERIESLHAPPPRSRIHLLSTLLI